MTSCILLMHLFVIYILICCLFIYFNLVYCIKLQTAKTILLVSNDNTLSTTKGMSEFDLLILTPRQHTYIISKSTWCTLSW
jgi:hypothetical protein